jgi:hypothetical protein
MIATLALALLCTTAAGAEPGITGIAATPDELVVRLDAGAAARVGLVELEPYATYDTHIPSLMVWWGDATAEVRLPRFENGRDRMFCKFQLVSAEDGALGAAHYVDDLSALPSRETPIPWPNDIKGLQIQMPDDAIALGVKYAGYNVIANGVIDWSGKSPETVTVDGAVIHVNTPYLEYLDKTIKPLSDAGMNVTLIVLNGVPSEPDPNNPFIHPRTDLANAPYHLGAFNTTDGRGLLYYRAMLQVVAERYSRPGAPHGLVSGYIIGNEVQSHWEWYNIGECPLSEFVADYGIAMRLADLTIRSVQRNLRVYVSMDHFWMGQNRPGTLKSFQGRRFLEGLTQWSREGGDFPWNVAFHPYPENLYEPRFWNDKTALMTFDTPRVTFKNIEVLPAFLSRPEMLCQGKPRRIVLSEQGFATPNSPDGQAIQAAAFARAWVKLSHMPTIDAFILHRHVDHEGEAGLQLGLWNRVLGDPDPCKPNQKKLSYNVFLHADQPDWREAFAPYLKVAGLTDWDEALPNPDDVKPSDLPPGIISDLCLDFAQGTVANALDCRLSGMEEGEQPVMTIFHHPKMEGETTLTFPLHLPPLQAGQRVEFRFGTAFSGPTANGGRFAVRVDGTEVWSAVEADQTIRHYVVDLSGWAGKDVGLQLAVDGLGDVSSDWANWVRPQVLVVE